MTRGPGRTPPRPGPRRIDLGVALVAAALILTALAPVLPDAAPRGWSGRAHRVDRVVSLVAYCGLAGAGPGTVGRL